jgi:hypothetical protein
MVEDRGLSHRDRLSGGRAGHDCEQAAEADQDRDYPTNRLTPRGV